jgi:hypothetical protein
MISWIKSLCRVASRSDARQTDKTRTVRLDELLQGHGKAHSEALIAFANSIVQEDFIDTVACHSLVGSAIRGGKIDTPAKLKSGTSSFETFTFSQEQVAAMIRGASIEQSIFLLRKEHAGGAKTGYTQFSIGRAKDSDIRIVDFAVSRNHACIEIQRNGFAIRDCDSRNGTRINGVAVSGTSHSLSDGDTITLGRYDFTFLSPASLYKTLRGR